MEFAKRQIVESDENKWTNGHFCARSRYSRQAHDIRGIVPWIYWKFKKHLFYVKTFTAAIAATPALMHVTPSSGVKIPRRRSSCLASCCFPRRSALPLFVGGKGPEEKRPGRGLGLWSVAYPDNDGKLVGLVERPLTGRSQVLLDEMLGQHVLVVEGILAALGAVFEVSDLHVGVPFPIVDPGIVEGEEVPAAKVGTDGIEDCMF